MRHTDFLRSILSLMAISMLVVALGLTGCPDDDDDDEALAEDLEGQSFTFPGGGAFGIPAGQSFTLTFGDFEDSDDVDDIIDDEETGDFTLTSGTSTATGEVTLGSCSFVVETSNFTAGTGPQVDDEFTFDPCEVDSDGSLVLVDEEGNEIISNPGTGATGSTGG